MSNQSKANNVLLRVEIFMEKNKSKIIKFKKLRRIEALSQKNQLNTI